MTQWLMENTTSNSNFESQVDFFTPKLVLDRKDTGRHSNKQKYKLRSTTCKNQKFL
ncbi:putative zinc transporter ZIP13-like isoform X1 [Sesbania bispinosa]|nr:putative zinc transporter ZIP13-like isoform X1 [Sesbania bispinosa]